MIQRNHQVQLGRRAGAALVVHQIESMLSNMGHLIVVQIDLIAPGQLMEGIGLDPFDFVIGNDQLLEVGLLVGVYGQGPRMGGIRC